MTSIHYRRALFVLCCAALVQACSGSSSTPAGTEHIRGTVTGTDGDVLTISTAAGSVSVQLGQPTRFAIVAPSDADHIRPGSFVGITSLQQPDGSQRAVEVHVFPESMRGTGEGSQAWDFPGTNGPPSRMTNGTVAASRMTNGTITASRMTNGTVAAGQSGSALTVAYKEGSQSIAIPPGIPIVALEPGERADVKPGAHVFVIAHRLPGGTLVADRVMAGSDGLVPPM